MSGPVHYGKSAMYHGYWTEGYMEKNLQRWAWSIWKCPKCGRAWRYVATRGMIVCRGKKCGGRMEST